VKQKNRLLFQKFVQLKGDQNSQSIKQTR